jgi:FtsH-binding integral membrane protein
MEYEDDAQEPFLHPKDEEMNLDHEIQSKIREGFIYKVFGIVLYQILILFMMVFLGYTFQSFHDLLLTSKKMFIITFFIFFTCLLLPIFNPSIYRTVPTNYIVLTIFSLSFGWWIAAFTILYTKTSVLFVLCLTVVTVASLTVYAFFTKKDYTVYGSFLFTALIVLIVASLLELFFPIPILRLIISYFSLMLFSIYLIYDVQLVIGDKKHKFSEDDYILAALNIYLDIVNIFIELLQLLGTRDS